MKKILANLFWLLLAIAGAWAYATLALRRGEPINSAYIVLAALCSYAIGYRFYSKWIAVRVLMLNDRRATPCEVHDDGKDFVKTNKWIVFGHHFAAIAGPGPLLGPVLAAQFGYLPGTLWILIGVTLGGGVQLEYTPFGWRTARSQHTRGANLLLADGSVSFVTDSIDAAIWKGLSTRSGGETTGLP